MVNLLATTFEVASGAAGVLAFRGLPAMSVLSVSSRRATCKVAAIVVYALVVAFAAGWGWFRPVDTLLTYAYFGTIALAGYLVKQRRSIIGIGRVALFAGLTSVLMLIPTSLRLSNAVAVVLGFETLLSVYSFCVDGSPSCSIGEYLFFVFVNPAVAYPRCGVKTPRQVTMPAIRLLAQGTGVMVAAGMLLTIDSHLRAQSGAQPLIAGALSRVLGLYMSHIALADIQAGIALYLGWEVPQRYVAPYKATSPRDFWKRWNTYISCWAYLHIFRPLVTAAIRWAPTLMRTARPIANAAVVTATFALVGVLHDLSAWSDSGNLGVRWTGWFLANAALVLCWDAGFTKLERALGAGRIFHVTSRIAACGTMVALASQV